MGTGRVTVWWSVDEGVDAPTAGCMEMISVEIVLYSDKTIPSVADSEVEVGTVLTA